MTELTPGTVVLVGGGPGDPELITVAGWRAVQAADVVLYDHLAPQEVLADARPDAELVPVGKWPRSRYTPQEEINRLLVEHARAGRRVVRLKGGDPFVFGRGGEEWIACAEAGVPVQVIPGVSSAMAAPATAGIPVTHRSLSQGVTVVSGHVCPGDPRSTVDWEALARSGTTLVVLMGVKCLREIVDAIAAVRPVDTPAAIIRDAYHADQVVVRGTLADLCAKADAAGVRPPAVTIIGEVAGLELA